jgi:uncharacterized protein (DUF305 family)
MKRAWPLFAVLILLAGCGTAGETPAAAPPATAAVSPLFNDADVRFVRAIIPHHEQGITIAQLGAQRATNPDMQVLANAIVATQRDEVARLRGWLAAWQQPAATASAAADKDLAKLRKAKGEAFDKLFLAVLIAHQGKAVEIARAETAGGRNINAVAFAKQVDASRTGEIAQMRRFLS